MNQKFQVINESFVCSHCGLLVPEAESTCRNHCIHCLWSKHVDIFPGDRKETCHGMLKPVEILLERGEMTEIIFQCEKCNKKRQNRIAPDDDREELMKIWSNR